LWRFSYGRHGFTIHDSVALKHTQLGIPAFMKEKKEKPDVEKTEGLLMSEFTSNKWLNFYIKYTILEKTLTFDLLACNRHGKYL